MIRMQPWRNLLYRGDCLRVMLNELQDLQGKFKQIYIDPPFLSGTDYTLQQKTNGKASRAAELSETLMYSDKWAGVEEYLEFMKPRLSAMKKLLQEDGGLWVLPEER